MKREPYRAQAGVTQTLSGPIPHRIVILEGGVLLAPVKLVTDMRNNRGLCRPKRQGEKLVYALPGGGEVEVIA